MPLPTSTSVANLKKIVSRIKGKRIGVLGDLMLDRYLWGTASRLSPESPVPVVEFEKQEQFPGGAGNVAANLVALGARVEAFGVIGATKNADDGAGGTLRGCLRELGMDDRGVIADAGRVTTVKTRIIARHQQIVRLDQESRNALGKEVEDKIFRKFADSVKELDGLILSDYDKGVVTDSLSERVFAQCHKGKVPVFVSPKKPRLFAHRGARAVTCNLWEAGRFVTHALTDEKSIEEALNNLLSHFGCGAVVITRGPEGMSLLEEGAKKALHIPATSFEVTYARVGKAGIERGAAGRQVFDVTGAGDTVLSVLAAAVSAGAPVPHAAELANIAAGIVVGKLGTASVSPQELLSDLDHLSR
ncbi:MAG TPA: PfkB family carbohydrate kinase [Candidatus Acidoferrum sp.]|nr:PfkB family carbohydrate kinase [Candidatus Acidoferrum sp.]